jgi:hypothetical protein
MSKKLKSEIDYKPSTKESYDSPRIPTSMMIADEAGQWSLPEVDFNFKDFIKNRDTKLKFSKPKKKKQ